MLVKTGALPVSDPRCWTRSWQTRRPMLHVTSSYTILWSFSDIMISYARFEQFERFERCKGADEYLVPAGSPCAPSETCSGDCGSPEHTR